MNINKQEELFQQQKVLPNDVIEKAILLHQILKSQLPRVTNVSRATGMVFFYRFYEHEPNIYPKEFGLYAIACLHLATKVCESPIPITQFSNAISSASGDIRYKLQEIFETLDGIPSFSSDTFLVDLNEMLVSREMRVIVALQFNFEVVQPYDLSVPYIEKILKWHLRQTSEFFLPLREELINICQLFLNDLQPTSMFYIFPPELLAIAAINMVFKWLKLPLVSPKGNYWYNFLTPNLDDVRVQQAISEVDKFFTEQFTKKKQPGFGERRTKVPDSVMEKWVNYPYIPRQTYPLCRPPRVSMYDDLVKKSDSFKHSELDHVPEFPPPTAPNPNSKAPVSASLLQFQREFPTWAQKGKDGDNRKPKKNKHLSPQKVHGHARKGSGDSHSQPKRESFKHDHRRHEYEYDFQYDFPRMYPEQWQNGQFDGFDFYARGGRPRDIRPFLSPPAHARGVPMRDPRVPRDGHRKSDRLSDLGDEKSRSSQDQSSRESDERGRGESRGRSDRRDRGPPRNEEGRIRGAERYPPREDDRKSDRGFSRDDEKRRSGEQYVPREELRGGDRFAQRDDGWARSVERYGIRDDDRKSDRGFLRDDRSGRREDERGSKRSERGFSRPRKDERGAFSDDGRETEIDRGRGKERGADRFRGRDSFKLRNDFKFKDKKSSTPRSDVPSSNKKEQE